MEKPLKIAIDARMYGLEHAGIGRYILNLVSQIQKLDSRNDFFILLRENYYQTLRFSSPRFKKILADWPHYSVSEQFFLPLKLMRLKPNFVHFPHFNIPVFYSGKFVVTIHDLIKHTSRGLTTTTRQPWLYWAKYAGYRLVFDKAVRNALRIIVPSQAIKDELVKTYQVGDDKIVVIYEGVEEKFQPSAISHQPSAEILSKYKISKPFIIYTGSVYPHKNIERLLQVIKLLNDSHFSTRGRSSSGRNKSNRLKVPVTLVISCARNVFWERLRKEVKEIGVEKYIRLAGFVPDEDLALLYRQASCFVFPSLSEGFGLPGLEAMAAGAPVVCSDIPVLREVYSEAALFFDPLDPKDMAEKILKLIKDKKLQRVLAKKGLEKSQKYSWEKMADQTLKIYESCLSL